MVMEPLEALENAVAHHKGEMAPSVVARHATLTMIRRGVLAVGGLGVITAGLIVGEKLSPGIVGLPAIAATVAVWIGGFRLLTFLMRGARRAIARSTLASFEAQQRVGALGAGGSTASVSALITPAQKMALKSANRAASRAALKQQRARTDAPDRDAPDFDDA